MNVETTTDTRMNEETMGRAPSPQALNLKGVWHGNDGGRYYINQRGNEIFWYGEKDSEWNNVAHGKLSRGKVILSWSDVPKGDNNNSGILALEATPHKLKRIFQTGNFAGDTWNRRSA